MRSQHAAYEDAQSWKISTPDGHPAARFIGYLTYERAEQAATAIAAALPGKAWPGSAAGDSPLRQQALDASSTPEMLPLTRGSKPDWGYGCQWINWTMPDTRAQYEQMIAAHGVSPANCRTCAGIKKRWGRTVWLPRTGHWPRWNPSVHRREAECRLRTNYHWAMDAVIDHHLAASSRSPALVIFQTDGGPTRKLAAERYLCKAARLPLFWQFIGFGDPDDNEFAFLRKLDDLAVPARRVVDNAGFFHAGRDPRAVCDSVLYDRLLREFPSWLSAARTAQILR
ncbi:VWA domain-containing protein [Streptomyces lutosisoli]|uniref:VWA domain-containing protein n=1 Tax=Streptomyces lutosisoli TaxID=2665721 RepID=A0ABW2VWW2_9ACTN